MWLQLTKQLTLENLPSHHTCAGTTHKIAVAYLGRPHLVKGKGIPITGHDGPRGMWMQGSTYSQPRH